MVKNEIDKGAIVITGLGMVSSLGYDVVTSCAAFRAGLSRADELDYFIVIRDEDGDEENVVGHPIPTVTHGFQGFARLLCIGLPAFEDLLIHSNFRELDHSKTGIYLSLPDLERIHDTIFDAGSDETKKRIKETGGPAQPQNLRESIGYRLCNKLMELGNCPIPDKNWNEIYAGHAGVILAIDKAMKDLRMQRLNHCLIGGVDSLLEEETLEWLVKIKRLKTEESPVGLQPGEAGAFILLERYDTARERNADILAVILETTTGFEVDHLFTGKPAIGTGLSETLSRLISTTGDGGKINWIITDQNGETYRAYEWSNALVRLSGLFPGFGDVSLSYPAISFGDTGAASGAVAICTAVWALVRGYAPSSFPIIVSSSDKGERGAVLLTEFND